jgi:hypothetical protein
MIKGDKAYIIRYVSEDGKYSNYSSIVQKMIHSFEITAPPTTLQHTVNGTKMFSNPYYGIKMNYPSDWEISDFPESSFLPFTTPIITFVSPQENGSNLAALTIGVDSPPSTPFNQYPVRVLNNYKNDNDILNVHATELHPDPHRYVLCHQDDMMSPTYTSNKSESVTDVFIKGKHAVYDINFRIATKSEKYSNYLRTAQEMIDSFNMSNAKVEEAICTIIF